MSKITPLMTSLHMGYKAEERIKRIDNMLFNKCEDTKETILQAFWWYRKNSIPLDKVKQAREKMKSRLYKGIPETTGFTWQNLGINICLEILDRLITESEG